MRHLVVRLLIALDVILCLHPAWAWFLAWRWTGRLLNPLEFARLYVQAVRFVVAHVKHGLSGGGIGAWSVDWLSPPVRGAKFPENTSWSPQGSCGTCSQCCSTVWLPEPERISCPMLTDKGCGVYGGKFWDYFNCGRFPVAQAWADSYACPRFGKNAARRLPVA